MGGSSSRGLRACGRGRANLGKPSHQPSVRRSVPRPQQAASSMPTVGPVALPWAARWRVLTLCRAARPLAAAPAHAGFLAAAPHAGSLEYIHKVVSPTLANCRSLKKVQAASAVAVAASSITSLQPSEEFGPVLEVGPSSSALHAFGRGKANRGSPTRCSIAVTNVRAA